ncbi:MAG: hypothetical protein A3H98_12905 [Bacteroidetes bacterium RIFCSPLOWO2_02_FULL_36_8]|nr:MAG: hypothetical protein A3H98_12905 [Bacteroidetes bacterium RIFCSPLOWO2_02_FULL_36_8]OFY70635.1 MAG: hypothetical protein A3G23_07860 [Bacteroidetes bacterium RIFCSPLOWO2_12_FULL_37_12]
MNNSENIAWESLRKELESKVGINPDLQGILFLIGVQELGKGVRSFSKEEKTDLLHIAVCRLFSQKGYYEFEGYDEEGWPHWKNIKKLPWADLMKQEEILKEQILLYFGKGLR